LKKLVIYTDDEVYNLKLSDYLGSRLNQEFMIVVYSKCELVVNAVCSSEISVIITDERGYKELSDGEMFPVKNEGEITGKISKMIVLVNEKSEIGTDGKVVRLYKYMPTMYLLQEISSMCINISSSDSKCRITGVYSPIGGIGGTTFSIAVAKKLSMAKNVLYLNLEAYCPIVEEMCIDDRFSLSEALYEYSINNDKTICLPRYVQETEGISIIAPIKSLSELTTVGIEEWKSFINMIKEKGGFDEIVIELSEVVNNMIQLFNLCDQVIILCGNGAIQKSKLDLLKADIERELLSDFIEGRIKYIKLPVLFDQSDTYENIEKTHIGEWLAEINV